MRKPKTFEYDVASVLALGVRERQEDALAVAFADGASDGFAVLSDGMGGHAAGDLASRAIISKVFDTLTLVPDASKPASLLERAVQKANARVKACVKAQPEKAGMGGTVVAAHISEGALHWASVGDSVLYLFRGETLSRLNANHSMAPQLDMMVANGAISATEAAAHPMRNCLTSALTGDPIAELDCPEDPVELRPNDIILLASDGLAFLPDPIIEALLLRARNQTSRVIADDLLDALAKLNDPNQDNTSLIVIRPVCAKRREAGNSLLTSSSAVLKAMRRAVTPPVTPKDRGV